MHKNQNKQKEGKKGYPAKNIKISLCCGMII